LNGGILIAGNTIQEGGRGRTEEEKFYITSTK
jgi:hypothetical protein